MNKPLRIGMFAIAEQMFDGDIEPAVKLVMAAVVVLKAQHLHGHINYVAISPLFEELPFPGAGIPFYDWVITVDPVLYQRSIKAVKRVLDTPAKIIEIPGNKRWPKR